MHALRQGACTGTSGPEALECIASIWLGNSGTNFRFCSTECTFAIHPEHRHPEFLFSPAHLEASSQVFDPPFMLLFTNCLDWMHPDGSESFPCANSEVDAFSESLLSGRLFATSKLKVRMIV